MEQPNINTDDCWLYARYVVPAGYGRIYTYQNGKSHNYAAHRVMYEQYKGPIPEGLTIDHLCKVTQCINPDHLEAVTLLENVYRGKPGGRTHCKNGHELTESNIVWRRNKTARQCRICNNIYKKDWARERYHLERGRAA